MVEISEETKAMAKTCQEVVNQIAPLLFGKPSAVQGNIISMLLGMWLAGHHLVRKKGDDEEVRRKAEQAMRAGLMVTTTNAAFAYAADLEAQDEKEKRK